jgi:pseudaminic acid biosynthesis-associated methylase
MSFEMSTPPEGGTCRLESLWAGTFGDEYVERNRTAGQSRATFWSDILGRLEPKSVLEVGCNVGANVAWIARNETVRPLVGIDINERGLRELRRYVPNATVCRASGRELPFADDRFDLVFTIGVLIHQSDEALPSVMREIVRCSRRLVLCGEYFSLERTEVPYRGQIGALIKRDFGALYASLFPRLRLLERSFLGREDGWDDVTCWIFEKPEQE